MARNRVGLRFSPRDATVSGRAGAHQARPARRRRRSFQFERLEDRLAMTGDSTLVADPAAADDVVAAPIKNSVDSAPLVTIDDLSDRFQSAAELDAWLIEAAVAQWGHLFGQSTWSANPYIWYGNVDINRPIIFRANMFTNDAAVDGGMVLFSGVASSTNVQVEGVDEADLVETDGEFLYILSGNQLVIVEAGIGDELRVLSRIEIEGNPVGMYLDGDRLAIVSGEWPTSYLQPMRFVDSLDVANYSYSKPKTVVTVLDVADRAAPKLVQKSEMDGQLVASRVVDGQLRLVLSNSIHLPAPIARPRDGSAPVSPAAIDQRFVLNPIRINTLMATDLAIDYWSPPSDAGYVYETQEEYLARVKDELFKSAMPGVRVLGLDGEVISESPLVEVSDVYRPDSLQDREITTIATFDLSSNNAGPVDTINVFTQGATKVYATAESIYLFSERWNHESGYELKTAIRKFDFDADSHGIALSARGEVKGSLLNQFAADEHEGYLRVVVGGQVWGAGQSVFVLQQTGKRLEVVGSIEGIAELEQIYSVRFVGERAFFVTFRVVDPLFAVDLSDPTDPRLLGELKIPGYSDYLQPIDENHLLAIGRGADERTGLFEELQVSIFNIADLTDPHLVDRYSFEGGRAITTPATGDRWQRGDGDHHAVSFFADAGVFALPIFNTGEAGWWWGEADDTLSPLEAGQGGLQVFQIDVTTGFTPIGLIQHETAVERSLRIGEHLYVISSGRVTVHELADPTVELGSLSIAANEDAILTRITMFEAEAVSNITLSSLMVAPTDRASDSSQVERSVAHFISPMPEISRQGSRTPQAAQRARRDAFSTVDDLLLLSQAANQWAIGSTRVSCNPADAALGDEADEGSRWSAIGNSVGGELSKLRHAELLL